jgi:DNA polymerase-1
MRPLLYNAPPIPYNQRPSGCTGCIFGGMKVGGRGPEDSPFVIVGESPGSQELHRGYPFVGPSGKLLDETLAKAGLPENVEPRYINAIQCFPRKKEPEIMQQAVAACQSRLIDEIKKYPRKVILALGGPASASLTGNPNIKITRVRGQVIESPLAEHGIVLAVHPAYLMRQGYGYTEWEKDLGKAIDLLQDKKPKEWVPPTWSVVAHKYEYAALVNRAIKQPFIAGDIETSDLDYLEGFIISQGITYDGQHVYIIPNKLLWDCEGLTKRLHEHPGPRWIWQNGKFDVKWFRGEGILARVDEDTMLQSYALDERRGIHDLDQIAFRELGAPAHKGVLDQYLGHLKKADRSYAKVPRPVLYQYQAYDIAKTFQMFFTQQERVNKDPHTSKLYHRVLIPASECLTNVEMEGLALDPEQVASNLKLCDQELAEVTESIQPYALKHLGAPINIASPAQLSNLLVKMGLAKPGDSTDADAIIAIQRKTDHSIVRPIQKFRKVAKRKGTYVAPALSWLSPDGKVHQSFLLNGASTGRLACRDPNMQNMERGPFVRRQFIADPGEWLVEADLNQAELRSLAIMSGDPTLLRIYREGKTSIHKVTCEAFFGHNGKELPELSELENAIRHDQYMRAKAVNFGIVYGRSAYTLAEEFDIPLKEAQRYIDTWFARYPVAHAFIKECRAYPVKNKTMITVFGRKKRWGVVSHDNLNAMQNEAANYPHQSTASDINLTAAVELQPILKERWNARICNLVHDSIYFKIRQDRQALDEALTKVFEVMERVPKDWGLTIVPFVADAKFGDRWDAGSMHDWHPPMKETA